MAQICIRGWDHGARKVSHTKLLQIHAGMSLSEAKVATDRVLDGQHVVFSTSHTSPKAVVEQFAEIGFHAVITESDGMAKSNLASRRIRPPSASAESQR